MPPQSRIALVDRSASRLSPLLSHRAVGPLFHGDTLFPQILCVFMRSQWVFLTPPMFLIFCSPPSPAFFPYLLALPQPVSTSLIGLICSSESTCKAVQ